MENQDQHKTPEQQQHDQQDHPAGYFAKIGSKFIGSSIDSGQITVKESRVVMKKIIDGVHASDHYGIYSELLIKSP